jgi:hypothetical protein
LAACDKSVAILYERNQRPAEKTSSALAGPAAGPGLGAYGALEREIPSDWFTGEA